MLEGGTVTGVKFAIAPTVLRAAMERLKGIVEQRTTISILGHVLIRVGGDGVTFTATDMDLLLTTRAAISADGEVSNIRAAMGVEGEGSATAPAIKLHDIARQLPANTLARIAADEASLRIEAGRARLKLLSLPPDTFPEFPTGNLPHRFTLAAPELRRLLDSTSFAVSTEETRYYLGGVYLHAAGEELRAVAIDGHRLALARAALPDGAAGMPAVIVPRKTVTVLQGLLKDAAGDVAIALSEAKISFAIGDDILVSKVIDATYPDYERVIPAGNDRIVEIDRAALADAVDLVATIADAKTRIVKFTVEADCLTVSTSDATGGEGSQEIECHFAGEPVVTGFNAQYVVEIAKHLGGKTLHLEFGREDMAAIMRDPENPSTLVVAMPARV
jgi:DNA polymerase-3 subunit beta